MSTMKNYLITLFSLKSQTEKTSDITKFKQSEDYWFEFTSNENPFRISLSPTNEGIIIEVKYNFSCGKSDIDVIYNVKNDLSFETNNNEIDEILDNDFSSIKKVLNKEFESIVDINLAF